MSSQRPSPSDAAQSPPDEIGLERRLSEAIVERDTHVNAPAVTVRADRVQRTLQTLRDEYGFDHCSCTTAQERSGRFETIYHLTSYEDRTRELSVVVPVPKAELVSESGASVYATADWHEREASDLLGIEDEDHPDLRRILLPETWQGHPLRDAFDGEQSQVVTLRENRNPLVERIVSLQKTLPAHSSLERLSHLEAGPSRVQRPADSGG